MPKEQHPLPMQCQRTIHEARLAVFHAVDTNDGLEKAETFYQENEATLVPLSVDRSARTQGVAVATARRNTLQEIFNKDVAIAQQYQKGEIPGGSLPALIKKETEALTMTNETLYKRRPPTTPSEKLHP